MKYCDLHIHSVASDGTFTPKQIVERARNYHLSGIAVADHDSIAAVEETAYLAKRAGIDFAPAIEISTGDLDGRMHILGYYIDIHNTKLAELTEKQILARKDRVVKTCAILTDLGFPSTYEDITKIAGDAAIGRPHIAEHLVNIGAVRNLLEAFHLYLAAGKQAYVHKWAPIPQIAIDVIHDAGGVAIAAHPGVTEGMLPKIPMLVDMGIDGFEAYYPRHSHEAQEEIVALARKHDLVVTGGSDCHGIRRGDPLLGVFKTRYELMVKLRERWECKKLLNSSKGQSSEVAV